MRSKRDHDYDAEMPAGYAWVRFSPGVGLVLPHAAAEAMQDAALARTIADEEQRRQNLNKQPKAPERAYDKAQQSASPSSPPAAPPTVTGDDFAEEWHAPPGWHRVLPRLAELTDVTGRARDIGASADKDINERRARMLARLLELGPDRMVGRNPTWRIDLDALEASLPHFEEPVRAVRNAMALAEATGVPTRVTPMLLLGPPGVGKTHFSQRLAAVLGVPHGSVQFDQPTAGSQLRGSDKYWSNAHTGLLFDLLCLGEFANPLVLLDELDKSAEGEARARGQVDPLAQLHAVLEPETARCLTDVSVDVEFDASLVGYVATANTTRGIGPAILSRLQVFVIEPPSRAQAFDIARSVVASALSRFGLHGKLVFDRQALCVLAHLSPRGMVRATEQAVAAAVSEGRAEVGEEQVWEEVSRGARAPRCH